MLDKRTILNRKLSIENWLSAKLYRLHKLVVYDSLKRDSIFLLRYKPYYVELLTQANKRIGRVKDVNIYNVIFLDRSVNNILASLQRFFIKKDIPVDKIFTIEEDVPREDLNNAVSLLTLKAVMDAQVFTQQNYEQQEMIAEVSEEGNEDLTEEAIAVALLLHKTIKTNKKKQWNDVQDNRVRKAHRHANGMVKPINEPFILQGQRLMYPGDSSYGASSDLWLNCRCYLTYE